MAFDRPLPPTPTLETQRLRLRPLRLGDAPAIQRLFADWEVVRHLLARVPWPYPEDGAETNVRESLEKCARGQLMCWALTFRDGDDGLAGRIDLRPDQGDQEMRGFWLAKAHWGQGLMTEAADAVTAYAFDVLGWPHLYVTNAAANLASHRIKEKQGFSLIRTVDGEFVDGVRVKEVWLLTADSWRRMSANLS